MLVGNREKVDTLGYVAEKKRPLLLSNFVSLPVILGPVSSLKDVYLSNAV
jgi:hypothetical protein